ncbi:lipase member H-like isoform X2 [Frankliniella occidentalis]|uniref:Lipase member H-like isoform X2 n=1 Tax=Frankliniella occidentalis TaxID=133901 RepID=A0A6J1TJC6_FRAOC|nr:lipase member H-like isoform X2 [Frankliniella occidentalis]
MLYAKRRSCIPTTMKTQVMLGLVLVHLTSGNVLLPEFAYLQSEIDEWLKLGKPTELAFHGSDISSLIDVPRGSQLLDPGLRATDYEGNVFFYFFNRDNPNGTLVSNNAQALSLAGFDGSRSTKIVIHGYETNITGEIFTAMVPVAHYTEAYVKKVYISALLHDSDCNVLGVDWGRLCPAPNYVEARAHVSGVAKLVAELLDTLLSDGLLRHKDVHIIGHSLGAHVAGTVGKNVKTGILQRITGDRLGRGDAVVVDVVHTCAGLAGLEDAIGDIDFYPNGGRHPQPGCGLLDPGCSHQRCIKLLAESAWEESAFQAHHCQGLADASSGTCGTTGATAHMSINLQYTVGGPYYLQTAASSPFAVEAHQAAVN